MRKIALLSLALLLLGGNASAFCGFFVAKADSKLFNKSSQVIIARDGKISTITMSNDFRGDVKDFAMVVPVPVVLKREQIRTVAQNIFSRVDAYSAPRLAEYYDNDPCPRPVKEIEEEVYLSMAMAENISNNATLDVDPNIGVRIEARYEVDEYDILILSAEESTGLQTWLNQNGYKIPDKARSILQPYIKSNFKFFVAKVNLDRHSGNGSQLLSPLQVTFRSSRFRLPIRLGMANADGAQDLIIHCYTRKGRVETTNYRTVKMPHDVNIPLFVRSNFGPFYKKVFDRQYKKQLGKTVFLEYSWDVSPRTRVKCDPCVGPPPLDQNLLTMGCDWLNEKNPTVFYTRLHVRYERKNFPQDLAFQITPNNERFQCRYVITHPPSSNFDCPEGQAYLKKLVSKRKRELRTLASLTGDDVSVHKDYVEKYESMITGDNNALPDGNSPEGQSDGSMSAGWQIWLIAIIGMLILLVGIKIKTLRRG